MLLEKRAYYVLMYIDHLSHSGKVTAALELISATEPRVIIY